MKIFSLLPGIVAGLAAAILQFGIANAGQIATPILLLSNNTNQVLCIASNIGGPIKVTVKVLGVLGDLGDRHVRA